MVKFIAKTPLIAIIYAAVLTFAAIFIPSTELYSEALFVFQVPYTGYLFMVVYGLYISLILASLYQFSKHRGFRLMLPLLLPVLVTQCVVPMLEQVMYGETTGVMSGSDSLMELLKRAVTVVFVMLVAALLFNRPLKDGEELKSKPKKKLPKNKKPEPAGVTYKIKKIDLAVKMLVLPVVYCVLYFLVWYFALWQSEVARVYYSGDPELRSFVTEIVLMLLENVRLVPMALLKGLLLTLCMIPLLKELESNRILFIGMTIALFLGPAVYMLIPSPVMPHSVRIAHLIELSVLAVLYGALTGFLMHISLLRRVPQQVVVAGPASKTKKGAAATEDAVAEAAEEAPKKGRKK